MYINLLLYIKVHICGLTLLNLNVCDIPVTIKPSNLVASVHIIDFCIHRDSETLNTRAVIIKAVSQASKCCVPMIHKLLKENMKKDLAVALNIMNSCYFFFSDSWK